MKKPFYYIFILFMIFSIPTLYSQTIKVAILNGHNQKDTKFFNILSKRSGITFEIQYMTPPEAEKALNDGIVEIAILPDNEGTTRVALIQAALYKTEYALYGKSDFSINEYNLTDIKTIGVFGPDEFFLNRDLIDKYSIDPRVQVTRHYDSLIRIISSGRVSAIFIPINEFEDGIIRMGEDRSVIGRPFIINSMENYLVVSKRKADNIAPLMDKLNSIIEQMKNDGSIDDLVNNS